jgi:hypothetical protein
MKVRCINNDPEKFEVSEDLRAHFRLQFGRGAIYRCYSVTPGREYVVYAIYVGSQGVPSYCVTRDNHRDPHDWGFVPSLCFEIVDPSISKLWQFQVRTTDNGQLITTLAIKEWIEDPQFHLNFAENRGREVQVMLAATAAMDAEHH